MKKVLIRFLVVLFAVLVVGGAGLAYWLLSSQDRGMSADGRMVPPASVRNVPEAPQFDASKTAVPATAAQKPPEYQLPTEFKLPTNLDISTPPVPASISAPAARQKS